METTQGAPPTEGWINREPLDLNLCLQITEGAVKMQQRTVCCYVCD